MTKLEKDAILPPRKPKLYMFFSDKIFAQKTNVPDNLPEHLDNYQANIKFTCETNPEKFLYTKVCCNNNTITIKMQQKVKNTKLILKYFEEI